MKYVLYSFFLVIGALNVTNASATGGLEPYKVTGIACAQGEHCNLISDGRFKGYYLKSNIPLNDSKQPLIRPNMFTKAVLKKELSKCLAKADQNPLTEEQCQGPPANPAEPFKKIGLKCGPNVVYCKKITEGPHAGLVEKSNIMPSDRRWRSLQAEVTPYVRSNCLRNGNVTCSSETVGGDWVHIGLRCGSNATYCKRITSGPYAGLIIKGSINVFSSITMSSDSSYVTKTVTPTALKCRPHFAYIKKSYATTPTTIATRTGPTIPRQSANLVLNQNRRTPDATVPTTVNSGGDGRYDTPPLLPNTDSDTPTDSAQEGEKDFLDIVVDYIAGGGLIGRVVNTVLDALGFSRDGDRGGSRNPSGSDGLNDPGGLDGGSHPGGAPPGGHHSDSPGSGGGSRNPSGSGGLNDPGGLDGGSHPGGAPPGGHHSDSPGNGGRGEGGDGGSSDGGSGGGGYGSGPAGRHH